MCIYISRAFGCTSLLKEIGKGVFYSRTLFSGIVGIIQANIHSINGPISAPSLLTTYMHVALYYSFLPPQPLLQIHHVSTQLDHCHPCR
jgi:hypothetical protein